MKLTFNPRSTESYKQFLQLRSSPVYSWKGNAAVVPDEYASQFGLLFSNPGEIVFSPFTGIGSEGYVSLGGKSPKTGKRILDQRRFYGCELKPEYYKQACKNLEKASGSLADSNQGTLFDLMDFEDNLVDAT